jgi:hypothetical protein
MSTSQPSSSTSAPSVLIVSDDTGNLDNSWLNANYPPYPPACLAQFALAQDLQDVFSYTLAAGQTAQQTDMSGNPLPRFVKNTDGSAMGLMVEPGIETVLSNEFAGETGSIIIEGYLPSTVPSTGKFELCRLVADAMNYLVVAYGSNQQLGIYLTYGPTLVSLVSSVAIAPGGLYKLAIAYSTNVLTAFAVNGKNSLSLGTLNMSLPAGITNTLNLSSSPGALVFRSVTGYKQALSSNQLKYLTSV